MEEIIKNVKKVKNRFGDEIITFEIGEKKFSYIPETDQMGVEEDISVIWFSKNGNIEIRNMVDAEKKTEAEEIIEKIQNF